MVYDRTCTTRRGALTPAWRVGARLYRVLDRIDAAHGVSTWREALAWTASQREPIRELQYWGHGMWGAAKVDSDALDASALSPGHRLHAGLEALRERLAPGALVWFRTCQTLGAARGIAFAERLADFLGARVAGHTFVIGFHQSGLRGLAPGTRATWSAAEGLAAGTGDEPERAHGSSPAQPRTITCLTGSVPAGWI